MMKKLLWYDIKQGGRKNRFQWLMAFLLLLFLSRMNAVECEKTFGDITPLHQLFLFMSGIPEYVKTSNSTFRLPVIWLVFHSYLLFLVSVYPETDFKGFGKKIMLLGNSRELWWLSKCCWAISCVCLYYLLLYLAVLGNAFLWKPASHIFDMQKTGTIPEPGFLMMHEKVLILILLPVLISCVLACIQVFFSLFYKAVPGYLALLTFLILSAYLQHPLLIGNYLMALRNTRITGHGVSTAWGIFIGSILLVLILPCGKKIMKRHDILL